ncbi:MAG: hypothetical protein ACYTFI_09795, partial [Planctomycetota bacterium]
HGTVLDVWAGSMVEGSKIALQELRISHEQRYTPGAAHWPAGGRMAGGRAGPARPLVVTAQRIVLFLRRSTSREKASSGSQWQPANPIGQHIRYSVIWIDGEKLYAWQRRYMRKSELSPLQDRTVPSRPQPLAPAAFKGTVIKLLHTRRSLRSAAQTPDRAERARKLIPFVSGHGLDCRREAFARLAECGKDALPAFRVLLSETSLLHRADEVMRAMVKGSYEIEDHRMIEGCGKDSKPVLVEVLRDEIDYWEKAGPALRNEWGRAGMGMTPENGHYRRLEYALLYLGDMPLSADEKQMVAALRRTLAKLPPKQRMRRRDNFDDEFRVMRNIDKILGASKRPADPRVQPDAAEEPRR